MADAILIYRNDGLGGPLDERAPVATLAPTATTWLDPVAVPAPGDVSYRAARRVGTVESLARSAPVRVVTDTAGADLAGRPNGPAHPVLRAAGVGSLRVEWAYLPGGEGAPPTEFRVCAQPGPTIDFSLAPTAVIPAAPTIPGAARYYWATLPGLTAGSAYAVAVRAANLAGEQPVSRTLAATVPTAGPAAVDGATFNATAAEG
jgi:hypothetical protein